MDDLKTGDVIRFIGDDVNETVLREEIMGRVDQVIFTRSLLKDGAVGSLNPAQLIEDYVTYGWTKEIK